MSEEPRSIGRICDAHPRLRPHSEIRAVNPDAPRCAYCGRLWPKEILIDDSDPEPSIARSSRSTSGYISALPTRSSRSPASSGSSSQGRSINLKQYSHFNQMRAEATSITRASKEVSPFDNTIGLQIRIKALHSVGSNLIGGFFKASYTQHLGLYFTLTLS